VAIRGGGHNVGGRALCDGGLVIDLSAMKGVHVDTRSQTVRVQAGATLGDVDRETHLFGLAVPAGVVSKTGIAGLTLGGGVGWLVRKHGLTCDNVLSFDLVTADGEVLTVSAHEHADLFWALRGGGGNFGVVTSFLFRAYPLSTVLGGMVLYPREQAVEILRFYRDFIPSAPDDVTAYCGLLNTPDGTPAIALIACWSGEDEATGHAVLAPLRDQGTPLLDGIQRMPFPQMQCLLDGAFPSGNYNYWKSSFVDGLSDDLVDAIVEHAAAAPSPLTALVIENYGGAAARVGVTETAFAHRDAAFDVGTLTQWTDPAQSDANIAWARALGEALKPHSSGYLLNFLDQEGDETIRAAFGVNYARLAGIKAKYDPTNFFHLNQNIRPGA
jgi:FAD/FMN-containing dehydrogenase